MLVVAEEKATVALTLVAAHGVDTDLLAAAVVVLTLVHICKDTERDTDVISFPRLLSRHCPERHYSDPPQRYSMWYSSAVLHRAML